MIELSISGHLSQKEQPNHEIATGEKGLFYFNILPWCVQSSIKRTSSQLSRALCAKYGVQARAIFFFFFCAKFEQQNTRTSSNTYKSRGVLQVHTHTHTNAQRSCIDIEAKLKKKKLFVLLFIEEPKREALVYVELKSLI